jgi:flagellar biosynthesis/type III secretory pathway M-ring protein FliF/YscJ
MVESMIRKLNGVVWALVTINHPHASVWRRSAAKPTAFVYIETEGDRQLPFKVIQSISNIIVGCEPDLTGSITVMDARHRYLDPGNPTLGEISRKHAREEELSEKLLEQLDYIKGVRVHVRVFTPKAVEPVVSRVSTGAVDTSPRSQTDGFKPSMRINGTLELEPEPPPTPISVPIPVASQERGKVLVSVPRSYYFKAMIDKSDNREPSAEELREMAQRTETQIRHSVDLVVSESGSWEILVDTIPDDVPRVRTRVPSSAAADPRRKILDWAIVGAVAISLYALVLVMTRIQVARRPARLPEPTHKTRRYHADFASDPGPSERVRELIRRNPEAAASVLQRWTGQGGRVT